MKSWKLSLAAAAIMAIAGCDLPSEPDLEPLRATLSSDQGSTFEADSNGTPTPVVLTFELNRAVDNDFEFQVWSSQPEAVLLEEGFTIPAGERRHFISVLPNPDGTSLKEDVNVTVYVAGHGVRAQATVRIIDVDPISASVSPLEVALIEAGEPATLSVQLSAPATEATQFFFENPEGLSLVMPGSVTVAAGASSQSFTVRALPDANVIDETLRVVLRQGNGTDQTVGLAAYFTVTVDDDDVVDSFTSEGNDPAVSFGGADTIYESGSPVGTDTITLVLKPTPPAAVAFYVSTTDPDAVEVIDTNGIPRSIFTIVPDSGNADSSTVSFVIRTRQDPDKHSELTTVYAYSIVGGDAPSSINPAMGAYANLAVARQVNVIDDDLIAMDLIRTAPGDNEIFVVGNTLAELGQVDSDTAFYTVSLSNGVAPANGIRVLVSTSDPWLALPRDVTTGQVITEVLIPADSTEAHFMVLPFIAADLNLAPLYVFVEGIIPTNVENSNLKDQDFIWVINEAPELIGYTWTGTDRTIPALGKELLKVFLTHEPPYGETVHVNVYPQDFQRLAMTWQESEEFETQYRLVSTADTIFIDVVGNPNPSEGLDIIEGLTELINVFEIFESGESRKTAIFIEGRVGQDLQNQVIPVEISPFFAVTVPGMSNSFASFPVPLFGLTGESFEADPLALDVVAFAAFGEDFPANQTPGFDESSDTILNVRIFQDYIGRADLFLSGFPGLYNDARSLPLAVPYLSLTPGLGVPPSIAVQTSDSWGSGIVFFDLITQNVNIDFYPDDVVHDGVTPTIFSNLGGMQFGGFGTVVTEIDALLFDLNGFNTVNAEILQDGGYGYTPSFQIVNDSLGLTIANDGFADSVLAVALDSFFSGDAQGARLFADVATTGMPAIVSPNHMILIGESFTSPTPVGSTVFSPDIVAIHNLSNPRTYDRDIEEHDRVTSPENHTKGDPASWPVVLDRNHIVYIARSFGIAYLVSIELADDGGILDTDSEFIGNVPANIRPVAVDLDLYGRCVVVLSYGQDFGPSDDDLALVYSVDTSINLVGAAEIGEIYDSPASQPLVFGVGASSDLLNNTAFAPVVATVTTENGRDRLTLAVIVGLGGPSFGLVQQYMIPGPPSGDEGRMLRVVGASHLSTNSPGPDGYWGTEDDQVCLFTMPLSLGMGSDIRDVVAVPHYDEVGCLTHIRMLAHVSNIDQVQRIEVSNLEISPNFGLGTSVGIDNVTWTPVGNHYLGRADMYAITVELDEPVYIGGEIAFAVDFDMEIEHFLGVSNFSYSSSGQEFETDDVNADEGFSYWTAFPPHQSGTAVARQLWITSDTAATVTITTLNGTTTISVPSSGTTVHDLGLVNIDVPLTEGTYTTTVHIDSNRPISIVAASINSNSTATWKLLPSPGLGFEYAGINRAGGDGEEFIMIVAVKDNTTFGLPDESTVTIDEGEVYIYPDDNFDGDIFSADKPFVFITGNTGGEVPFGQPDNGTDSFDMFAETMLPLFVYTDFDDFAVAPPHGDDSLWVRCVAIDATTLYVNNTQEAILSSGDVYDVLLDSAAIISGDGGRMAPFVLTYSDTAITQSSDPSLTTLVPLGDRAESYHTVVANDAADSVFVVLGYDDGEGAFITVNGVAISLANEESNLGGTGYTVNRLILAPTASGKYVFEGDGNFTVLIYGVSDDGTNRRLHATHGNVDLELND